MIKISVTDEEFLYDQYWNKRKSIQRIADDFNTTYKKIRYWLMKNYIPIRSLSESHKGLKFTPEHRKKLSEAHIGVKAYNWKGDKVGYNALHAWVARHKPKQKFCAICGWNFKLELSNISGEYKRDINDFQWVCRVCHRKYDKRFI